MPSYNHTSTFKFNRGGGSLQGVIRRTKTPLFISWDFVFHREFFFSASMNKNKKLEKNLFGIPHATHVCRSYTKNARPRPSSSSTILIRFSIDEIRLGALPPDPRRALPPPVERSRPRPGHGFYLPDRLRRVWRAVVTRGAFYIINSGQ